MNRIITTRDASPESKIRRRLWIEWIIVIGIVAWMLASTGFSLKSVLIASAVTLAGIPVGWLFGSKLGYGPIFMSVYDFKKKAE